MNLDPQVLYRILENLIGNALRYAKSEIRLSFACENAILKVCVADDGPGFSERIRGRKAAGLSPTVRNRNMPESG